MGVGEDGFLARTTSLTYHTTMSERSLAALLIILIGALGILGYAVYTNVWANPQTNTNTAQPLDFGDIQAFDSVEDFRTYLAAAPSNSAQFSTLAPQATRDFVVEDIGTTVGLGTAEAGTPLASRTIERVSETNVQVQGIDEPDIVKTNGTSLFISQSDYYGYPIPLMEDVQPSSGSAEGESSTPSEGSAAEETVINPDTKAVAPDTLPVPSVNTDIITAFPIAELAKSGSIAENGNLLLTDNILVIFLPDRVVAYDVSNPGKPEKTWTLSYDDNHSLASARLLDGHVYLVTQGYVDRGTPCPIEPFTLRDTALTISCGEIFHPVVPVDVDVTYTAAVIDPKTGTMTDSISFVGAQNGTTVYMSPEALYVFYTQAQGYDDLVIDFTLGDGASLFPASLRTQLTAVKNLSISDEAKYTEFTVLLERHLASLTDEEQLTFQNQYEQRFQAYLQARVRELDASGIVKIGLDTFEIVATGEVPGYLLNQFSVDEHKGFLRVATTSGSGFGMEESVNDVYVLDENLAQVGSVLGMGLGERIYSARFIGDRGYVVTFKQIDPFYVLDLSNPRKPEQTGELKIPGFSSYLHPLTENLVLGVGEESGQTKLSLFTVADPADPVETATFKLDAFWNGVQESHHAFLQDAAHKAFFLPAGADGYVFSYTNDGVTLEKKVEGVNASRAVYINDLLYVVGATQIVVLDENTWEQVASLAL